MLNFDKTRVHGIDLQCAIGLMRFVWRDAFPEAETMPSDDFFLENTSIWFTEPYTIVVLGECIGIARCNASEPAFDPKMGLHIAFKRAVRGWRNNNAAVRPLKRVDVNPVVEALNQLLNSEPDEPAAFTIVHAARPD